jgi:hypothetical protein
MHGRTKVKSLAVNTEIYINERLQPRLLPFIHKHHGDFNYLFWPDLARAHYSKESVAWMNENVYSLPPLIRKSSGGKTHSGLRLFRINEIKIFFNKMFYLNQKNT